MYDPIWTCRDGRKLKASQMSDSHLANAISRIVRRNWRPEWLARLQLEVVIRRIKK